jgi:hypothetical protein
MTLDPDPLVPLDYDRIWADGYSAGWQDAPEVRRPGERFRPLRLVIVLATGIVIGILLAPAVRAAAPRSAPEPVVPASVQESSGAPQPATPREAAVIPAGVTVGPVAGERNAEPDRQLPGASQVPAAAPRVVHGIASFVGSRYGPRYLALPGGPGHRVTVCGRAGCVQRTSTDAGPALFLQRAGRVADLSRADFARVCGCSPELVGLTRVIVTYGQMGPAPTPPATDVTP